MTCLAWQIAGILYISGIVINVGPMAWSLWHFCQGQLMKNMFGTVFDISLRKVSVQGNELWAQKYGNYADTVVAHWHSMGHVMYHRGYGNEQPFKAMALHQAPQHADIWPSCFGHWPSSVDLDAYLAISQWKCLAAPSPGLPSSCKHST